MEGKGEKGFRAAALFLSSSILLVLMGGIASGEGLYTRTDALSCGTTVVQAFTTCTEDSHDDDTAVCTEQHLVFVDKKTGASVRVRGPGEPIVERDPQGKPIRAELNGLARDWACLQGTKGPYVVLIDITWRQIRDRHYHTDYWEDILDLKGKRLARNRGMGKASRKFFKAWFSLGLMPYPFPFPPFDAFVPIQLFKTDRRE